MVFREGFIETAEGPTFVREIGRGAPLFIVHGGPGFDHRYLFKSLEYVAERRTLIFYDQPGCGLTPKSPRGLSLATTACHFAALVKEMAIENGCGFLAHSWGALVAIAAFAESRLPGKEVFREGVLINPVPVTRPEYEQCRATLLNRIPVEIQERAMTLMASGGDGAHVIDLLLPYYHARPVDLSVNSLSFRYDTYFAVNEFLGDFDFGDRLDIAQDLTTVHGEHDFTAPDLIRGITLISSAVYEMPLTGHFPFVEHLDSFREILNQIFA